MKVNRIIRDEVVRNIYEIGHEDYGILNYIEFVNETGRVIDEELRDCKGNSIDDPALMEDVKELVDGFLDKK